MQELQIRVVVAQEVMHGHVAGLAVAVEAAISLLQARGVPGAVVVEEVAGAAMQVEPLGRGVGRHQDAYGGVGVVEGFADAFAGGVVHAALAAGAEEGEHARGGLAVRGVPFPKPAFKVVQGRLVLGEDDEPFVVAEGRRFAGCAREKQESLDQFGEGVEPGVGARVLFDGGRAFGNEAEVVQRDVDGGHLSFHGVRDVAQPGADDAGRRACALLGLPVVRRFPLDGALRRRDVGVGRRVGGLLGARVAVAGPAPGVGEGGRAGEKALAQDLDREGPGAFAGMASRDGAADGGAEGGEGRGEGGLARVAVEQERRRFVPSAEAGRGALLVQFALEAADDQLACAAPLHVRQFVRLAEPHRVENLQQAGEGAGVPVVRRRGEEEPVLEARGDPAQHLAQLAVGAERRRHQVVALVDDQQVPGEARRVFAGAARGEELLLDVGLSQVVVRGHDPAERAPGIRVDAQFPAQLLGPSPVDDLERQRELVVEFVAPLQAQRRRHEDEHPTDAPA